MMTRHTSKRKIRLLQAAGACVASLCLLVLSQHTNAQDTANRQKATTENKPLNQSRQPAATQQMGISPAAFENYQKEIDSHRVIKGKDTTWLFLNSEAHKLSELHAIYQSMSPLQQKKVGRFPPPPPPPPPLKTKNGAHKAPPPPPPPAKTKKEAVNPPPPPPPAKPSAASPAVKAVQPLPALSPVVAVQQVTGNTKSVTPLQRHLAD